MIKVLFVCLGNICRSPAAEAVFKKILEKNGLTAKVEVSSAGTSAYHAGNPADARMQNMGTKRGYALTSRAKQITFADLEEFDYIITMDRSNYCDVKEMMYDKAHLKKLHMLCSFCCHSSAHEVPDPYLGGEQGFAYVFDLLEDACRGLLVKIKEDLVKPVH